MNLQQLEYLLALDTHRHFARAAEACHVTQPTLSTMVQRLEAELGIQVFERGKQGIRPTVHGAQVLAHARSIVGEMGRLRHLARHLTDELTGELRLGVIPTVAPDLLPDLLPRLSEQLPGLQVRIHEGLTAALTDDLLAGRIDIAVLATPADDERLAEHPLYDEPLVGYGTWPDDARQPLTLAALTAGRLWLLEEGHCFRSQIVALCELRQLQAAQLVDVGYETGSLDTLVRLVDRMGGATVLPARMLPRLPPEQQRKVRAFPDPQPVRSVRLVCLRTYPRRKLVQRLVASIQAV